MTRLEKILLRVKRFAGNNKQTRSIYLDIGSHTTKILADGEFITEPTCFVHHLPTQSVLAVGERALRMFGKLPQDSVAVFPVRAGKIVDGKLFQFFLDAVLQAYIARGVQAFLHPPKVIASTNYHLHHTQSEAWKKGLKQWGHNVKVMTVNEALWKHVISERIFTDEGCVIDLGAMTTKLFLYTSGKEVATQFMECGGNTWTQEVIQTLRKECHIEVGWMSAESLKTKVFHFGQKSQKHTVHGKDIVTGLPVTKVIDDSVFAPQKEKVVEKISELFEKLCQQATPEVIAKIYESGVFLTGGTSRVPGLPEILQTTLKLPVHLSRSPQRDIVHGLSVR
jgi:rod shape-determining protein MreB and related proteins